MATMLPVIHFRDGAFVARENEFIHMARTLELLIVAQRPIRGLE